MATRTYDQPSDSPYFMDAPISSDAALAGDLQKRFDQNVYPQVGVIVEALGNPNSPAPIPGLAPNATAPVKMLADTDFRIAGTLPGPGAPVGGSLHSFGSSFCLSRTGDGLGLLPGQRLGNMIFDVKRANVDATFIITGDGSSGDSISFYVGDVSTSGEHILLSVGAAGASWRLGANTAADQIGGSHALIPAPERVVRIVLADRAVSITVDGVDMLAGVALPSSVPTVGRLLEVEFQNDGTEPNMYVKRMILIESVGLPEPTPPTDPGPGANAALFMANFSSATATDAVLPDPLIGGWAWQPGAANLHTDIQGMHVSPDGGSVYFTSAPFTPQTGGTEVRMVAVAPENGYVGTILRASSDQNDGVSVNQTTETLLNVSVTAGGFTKVNNAMVDLSAVGVAIPGDSAGTYRVTVRQNLVDATLTIKINDTVAATYSDLYFSAPFNTVTMNTYPDADTGVRYETLAAYGIKGTPKPKPKPVYDGSNTPEAGSDTIVAQWNFVNPDGLVAGMGTPVVDATGNLSSSGALARDAQGLTLTMPDLPANGSTTGQINEALPLGTGMRLTMTFEVAAGFDSNDNIGIEIYDRNYSKHFTLNINGGYGIQGALTYPGHNNNAFTENGNAGIRVQALSVGEHTIEVVLHNAWTWEATLDGQALGSGDLIEWSGWGSDTCNGYISRQTYFESADDVDPLRLKTFAFAQL